ncbi:hypothetical protein EYF80_035267 [Liparis tanakae]|uniref:Uncharacterized protein n=1 Tax=Liparis tanakae TaxID=230148 RepID=A0A4Z2GP95_9TELE|nr:hypothetical protein EYF80_035267 [Liparis tanakae]
MNIGAWGGGGDRRSSRHQERVSGMVIPGVIGAAKGSRRRANGGGEGRGEGRRGGHRGAGARAAGAPRLPPTRRARGRVLRL